MNRNMIKKLATILTNVSLLEAIVPLPLRVGPNKHINHFLPSPCKCNAQNGLITFDVSLT
jgi:hypothetical protein